MKNNSTLTLILGLWLGGSFAVLGVVGLGFGYMERAFEVHPKLAEKAGFDPTSDERRETAVFVYIGELNRMIFYSWNRAQLILAALSLLVALLRLPRPGVVGTLTAAGAIVLVLTFYLEPEITSLGRELDLVPKDSPGRAEDFERFDFLHDTYTALEAVKILLLVVACFFALRGRAPAG